MARWRRRNFARDTRGATMIEFALLAPIFFALLAAILETALLFLAAQVFESAVQDATRAIRVGRASQEVWSVDEFKDAVCDRLFGLFGNCSDMYISVTQLNNFNAIDPGLPLDPDCTENCDWTEDDVWTAGASSAVMQIQAYYRYPTILQIGPFAQNALGDGRRLLSAATVFRNEPF